MARIDDFTCIVCDEPKREVVNNTLYRVCCRCRTKQAEIEKKAHMENLKLMPLEKRVAIIEEYLYDSKIVDRLKKLELPNQQIY